MNLKPFGEYFEVFLLLESSKMVNFLRKEFATFRKNILFFDKFDYESSGIHFENGIHFSMTNDNVPR